MLLGDFGDRLPLGLPHHIDLLLFTESTLSYALSRRSRRGSLSRFPWSEISGAGHEHGDNTSRELLQQLLNDPEMDHILWSKAQLYLIGKVGLEQYLTEQL